ncbi:Bys1 family protein [Verticillium alfalfae VaMs.102]|uniref:Bys1 family protein n=1 Tax=Verticillium alfalfae (strain VaMs.102 / ATCC MYA-4576 / FGSC 10136) TaxID=526221 RepID=C9SAF1_VERA1|nr:Bys1 family protein [Verticillium alfalfae VaMs.102]EEY16319.1 Bys1 family protein [Verticillium alfalfae VaMs.102]
MQIKASIIAALALTTPLVSAVGKARVVNNCDYEVSVWSVGSAIAGPYRLAPKSGSYAETFVKDPKTGGKAIKITTARDGLYTGAPQLNFAYSLDGVKIWYDLSSVFGDAFKGKKLVERSADSTCPAITWDNGTPPAGSQVKTCTSAKDVTLTLCA